MTVVRRDIVGPTLTKMTQPLSTNVIVLPQSNHRDPSLATEPLQVETHLLEGLEENFEYTVLVAVVNAAGSGIASDPLLQQTPQAG